MMWRDDRAHLRPMLASIGEAPLVSARLAYEPKYDGIRAIVTITPSRAARREAATPDVRLWSRLGNDKTSQFPEITAALARGFRALRVPIVLDGEVVALDAHGSPTSFVHLQSRIHKRHATPGPAGASAFIAFDLLREGTHDLRVLPLRERRSRLEKVCTPALSTVVRLSEHVVGDGRHLHDTAHQQGWEGLIAKRLDARYASGARTTDWVKLKLVHHQTCVIGGWTTPGGTRTRFGALLLGVYDTSGHLQHVGNVGTGFSGDELDRVWTALQPLAARTSPFTNLPRSTDRPHWSRPELVCEVKFTEWTPDGKLRHPTYLGLRDDVDPATVRREPQGTASPRVSATAPRARRPASTSARKAPAREATALGHTALEQQIDALEHGKGHGTLVLPDGGKLAVTNLGKLFWPELRLTKGDLLRHYARVAPVILPVLDDRPLVLKRYPNGVHGEPFYQHQIAANPPACVRVARVVTSDGPRAQLIGGGLGTLLYTAQLATISQDPRFSRLASSDEVDQIAFDLDPPDGTPFRQVLDLALHLREELDSLGVESFPKTSGSRGLHIFVPMPAGTPYDAGLIYAQIIATIVTAKHPRLATTERRIAARGGRIYLDVMQNLRGKTLASAYSVRANAWAGVSTPLTWREVERGVNPQDFTLTSFPARLKAVGDLWAGLRRATGADLRAVMKYAEPRPRSRARSSRR